MQRFRADHLVTMDPEVPVHSPGVVDVDGGRVVWSGPAEEAPPSAATAEVVSGALMPGFVNAHAHTPMTLLRGSGEGLPTDAWLTDVIWPVEAMLTADDVYDAMVLGSVEMLANGITTSSEMYFYGDAIARAAAHTGLRCIVAAALVEAVAFAHFGTIAEQIQSIRRLRRDWSGHPLIEVGVGPHSAYALSRSALIAVRDLVADDPMLVHIHVAEQQREGDGVRADTGLGVPAYLDDIGLLGPRTLAAHCVWMTDDDIGRFAQRGVGVAHCPVSNGRHASGIARVAAMRSAGISVGLGTDGPASHDRLDPFEEMRTAIRLARISANDAAQLDASTAVAMATRDAADAIGRPDLGRLTVGAAADMVAIDVEPSAALAGGSAGAAEVLGRIVWSGSPACVRSVWVAGRLVVASGGHTTVDRSAAAGVVAGRAERLFGAAR